jgi:hypothetical protein
MSKQANDIPHPLARAAVAGVCIYGCYWLGSKFKKEFQKILPSSKIDPAKLADAAAEVTKKINGFASEGEPSQLTQGTLCAMADHLTVFSQVVKDKPLELRCLNVLEDRVCTALGHHIFNAPTAMSLPSLLLKEDE